MTTVELCKEYFSLRGEKERAMLLYEFNEKYWIMGKDAAIAANIFGEELKYIELGGTNIMFVFDISLDRLQGYTQYLLGQGWDVLLCPDRKGRGVYTIKSGNGEKARERFVVKFEQ